MNTVWEKKEFSMEHADALQRELQLTGVMAELLASIGITSKEEAEKFLQPNYKTQIHDPFLLTDMKAAVERINQAIDNQEKVLLHGDYDCDGCTTIALGKEGFELLGLHIDAYAPNRFTDGYGLKPDNMKKFLEEYDLIISGDTGIRDFAAGELVANANKADLIITDHHEPLEGALAELFGSFREKVREGLVELSHLEEKLDSDTYLREFEKKSTDNQLDDLQQLGILPKDARLEIHGDHYIALPKALAVVDPQRLGNKYPCRTLAGVGVLFKVLQAVFESRSQPLQPLLFLLDYVATGSIADLAQQIDRKEDGMDFEVRTMCRFGLEVMNRKPKPWVNAIKHVKKIDKTLTSTNIGFGIGPLINAPGRLDDPTPAVQLLLEKDEEKAIALAEQLEAINKERQKQTEVYKEIITELKEEGKQYYDYGIVVKSDAYGTGIAGLIAGKLNQEFYRPSIALAPAEVNGRTVLKGSARSIPGVHILHMLNKVKDDIGSFIYGGHVQAAGMTLELDQFEAFRDSFRKHCMNHEEKVFVPKIHYDLNATLDEIDFSFMRFLDRLEPFGEGNKQPLFHSHHVWLKQVKKTKNEECLIFTFEQNNTERKGIVFRGGKELYAEYERNSIGKSKCIVDLLYAPTINVWNEQQSIQLQIEDMKFHS